MHSRRRIPLLARVLLGAAVLASFVLVVPTTASAGQQVAGVQTHLLWGGVSATEVNRQLDLLKEAGAGMTRVDLGWSSLEPDRKGQYSKWYLDKVDALVAGAEQRGIKILFTVTQTPCWATSAPESKKQGCEGSWWDRGVTSYAPARPADFGDAVGFLADRFKGRVAGWEIWNEPNSDYFLQASDPVAAYAELVQAAYPKVKAADPQAPVVAGSLMHSDVDFIRNLYEKGIKGSFDALSIHPYSDDYSPLDPIAGQPVRGSFVRGVPAVRQLMLANGDDKPLWLTEFGWNTSTVRNSSSWTNGVSESRQAEWLGLAVDKIQEWSFVEVAIWFNLVDNSSDRGDYISNFGLVRHDGSRKPAFQAFKESARSLSESGGPAAQGPAAATPTAGIVKIKIKRKLRLGKVRLIGRTDKQRSVRLRILRYRRGARAFRAVSVRRIAIRRTGRFARNVRVNKRIAKRMRKGRWHAEAVLRHKRARVRLG